MQKHFSTTRAQDVVLTALGATAANMDAANALFAALGITVTAKRVGRISEPVVTFASERVTANAWGEGEDDFSTPAHVDLSVLAPWMTEATRAELAARQARMARQAK